MANPVVIRGKLAERYVLLIICAVCLGGSFLTWRKFTRVTVGFPQASSVLAPAPVGSGGPAAQTESESLESVPAIPGTALVASEDGFISVPPDGVVPAGSSIRLDMSTGERTFRPPPQADTKHHRDRVDVGALRELRKQIDAAPTESTKWRQQYKGACQQIEDMLGGLSATVPADTAKATVEKLEDFCISSMSNATGIFNSARFGNLLGCLKHQDVSVRIATVSFMFYAIQNNHAPSEAFLMDSKALAAVSEVLDVEQDPTVVYKLISIIESSLAVCATSERFKIFVANLKEQDLFAKMTASLQLATNMAAPEKVITALTLVVQLTEDESCLLHLEQAAGHTKGLPRSLVAKWIGSACPLIRSRHHPKLRGLCQSL